MDRDLNGSINLENWTKNTDSLSVNACGQEGAVSLGWSRNWTASLSRFV